MRAPKGEHSYHLPNLLGRISMFAETYLIDRLQMEASLKNLCIAGRTYSLAIERLCPLVLPQASASCFELPTRCQLAPSYWYELAAPPMRATGSIKFVNLRSKLATSCIKFKPSSSYTGADSNLRQHYRELAVALYAMQTRKCNKT